MRFDKIDAVLKLTERCNINCTYCYMFNKGSELYREKPKQLSLSVARDVSRFLRQSALETGAATVRVIFHGGEPMMLGVAAFREVCEIFLATITPVAAVEFTMQTNAMLVNEDWISALSQFRVSVGVSLDGDRARNDLFRIDHRGRGTYDRTLRGVRDLFSASDAGRIHPPAVLCVIDPTQHGGDVFSHFVGLGFKWLDFLLPIDTREALIAAKPERVGIYLEQVFQRWNELADKQVTIRFFDQFYTFMCGSARILAEPQRQFGTLILSIESDGTFGPDDTLRIIDDDLYQFDCRQDSIADFLAHEKIAAITSANTAAPEACDGCAWAKYCVGGARNGRLINRYSAESGFAGRSGLCDALDHIYNVLTLQLAASGLPKHTILKRLSLQ